MSNRADHQETHHQILDLIDECRRETNPFPLTIEVLGDTPSVAGHRLVTNVRQGAKIRFRVRSAAAGHLSVFNIGTSGGVWLLFPNPWQRNSHVGAEETVLIPSQDASWTLELFGPPGTDVIQAFVTPVGLPIVDDPSSFGLGKALRSWRDEAAARTVRVVARELRKQSPNAWAEASVTFDVS